MRREYDFSKGKRGALIPQKGKTRISIFIDNATLDAFRERAQKAGTGYQTMMNEALRAYLAKDRQPITEQVLRSVLREERKLFDEIAEGFATLAQQRKGKRKLRTHKVRS